MLFRLRIVVHACNPNIQEAKAGGLLRVPGHSGLHREFQASLSYIMGPCFKNKKINDFNFSVSLFFKQTPKL